LFLIPCLQRMMGMSTSKYKIVYTAYLVPFFFNPFNYSTLYIRFLSLGLLHRIYLYNEQKLRNLKHVSNQFINGFFSVTPVTTLHERMSLVAESALRRAELERPHEVVSLLEVGTDSVELSDQILNTDDLVGSEDLLNDFVRSDGNSLLVDLSVSSLVDQVGDSVSGGVSESDKRLDLLDHVKSSSVDSDEDGIVDLSESEQLEDLFGLRSHMVDTSDSDHKDDSRFSGDVERTGSSGLSLKIYSFLLFSSEFLVMFFTSLSIFSSLGLGLSSLLGEESLLGIA